MEREPDDLSPPASAPPESGDAGVPPFVRVGTAAFGGAVAAIVAALPAAMRLAGGSLPRRWIALAAIATPLAVIAVGLLRRARAGATMLAGDRFPAYVAGFLLWATPELLLCAAFASLLRKHTHHLGLAGVTFAIFAVASGVGLALLVVRVTRRIAEKPSLLRFALIASALAAFVVVILAGVRTAHAEGLQTAAGLVDALALSIACGIASSRTLARQRPLALAGVPLSAVVVVLGFASLSSDPALREAIAGGAPIHALLLSIFGR